MKSMTKRTGAVLAVAAYAATVIAGGGIIGIAARADSAENEGLTYYYNNLFANPRAERFYHAFETLEREGAFKKDEVDFNIVEKGVVVGDDVRNYVENGSPILPVAYGAARDSYLMDHPDLFYADVFGVSVSAGLQNGNYVAYLDTSRTDTLYIGNLDTEEKINKAIDDYEKVLSGIVAGAKAAGGVKEQIEYVNRYMIDHTEYSFCSAVNNGNEVFLPEADYIETSYGALVNGKAICGGYAKGFKAVMDRLGIPCVCVQGYSHLEDSSNFTPHMWNAVKLEGMWYGVDVTWNDTSNDPDGWLLIGENTISRDHIEDKVVSSSGYELKYPALKPYDYGRDTDDNGMTIKGEYKDLSGGTGKYLTLTVVYEGMGASKLAQKGKYFAFRLGESQSDGTIRWAQWSEATSYSLLTSGFINCEYDDKTLVYLMPNIEYIQFALIDYAPDQPLYINGYPSTKPGTNEPYNCTYSEENLTDDHISGISSPYQNEGFGSYIPAPAATSVTPSNTGDLKVNGTYEMKFVYNEKLVLMEGKKPEDVKLGVTTSRGNDTVNEYIEIIDFRWDGDRTISFTFKPSKMYIHHLASYYFCPTNLVGEKSNKIPTPVRFSFKGKSVVCSRIFNDGRLYMSVFGEPKMLDMANLSVNNFLDENGNYYAKDQRSQLLLVADKPGNAKSEEMKDVLAESTGMQESDIVTTATYEIDLQICGSVTRVPNGSFMQVAFGFPEGFSPDEAGTTFKIYHYEHDDKGNITGVTEIPVIITEYGIIAQVKSFSPFAVVQVKKSALASTGTKSVYASVSGKGGVIQSESGTGGIAEVTGDTVTYTINADEGYQIDTVMLNGKVLGAERYKDGNITLSKSELGEGNTLEASFITVKSAENYQAKGVALKRPDMIVISPDEIMKNFAAPNGVNVVAVVVGCVCGAVAIGVAAAIVVVVLRKRGAKASAQSGDAAPAAKSTVKKSASGSATSSVNRLKNSTPKSAPKSGAKKPTNNGKKK